MNATKLGLRLTSPVLTTALVLAPITPALAAPPDEEAEGDAEGTDTEGEAPEGEAPEGEGAEGEEGGEIEIGGDEEGEGEAPEGEGEEGGEIEIGGDEEGEAAGEGPEGEGEGVEGEGEGEVVAVGGDEEGEGEGEGEGEEDMEMAEPDLTPEGPLRPPEPTWGPKDQYPMNGKGMLIAGGVVTGLGAGFILTAVLITRCDFDSALSCKFGDQRDFLVPTAVATTGLGLLLIGVGVGNHVKYKRWQNWTPEHTAVVPTMVPGGGGGLAWVGKF
jgi:hypothetical protein